MLIKLTISLLLLFIFTNGISQINSFTEIKNIHNSVNQINSIEVLKDSLILIATDAGILKIVKKADSEIVVNQMFTNWKINVVKAESNDILWLGTYNNSIVNILDNNQFKEYSFNNLMNGEVTIVTSIFVTSEELWIGTSIGKVLNFNKLSKKFAIFGGPGKYSISSIITDNTGLKWIATPTGLYYSYNCSGWLKVDDFSIAYDIVSGTKQLLAIGRDKELKAILMSYNTVEREWKSIMLPVLNDPFTKLKQLSISQGPIHYITMDYGIIEFSPKNNEMKIINTKPQLRNVSINRLASLGKGNVIISSAGRKLWFLVLE